MKKLLFLIFVLSVFIHTSPVLAAAATADFNNKVPNCGTNKGSAFNPSSDCLTTLPSVSADTNTVKTGLQVVFGAAAGVALISIGIAAFNFTTIATDAEKISRSKRAIEFSLVGLAIALLAEAIVTTVIGKL